MSTRVNQSRLYAIIQRLSGGQITDAEILFLMRRLRYENISTAWIELSKLYGQVESMLRDAEQRIVLRLSFARLTEVESWLLGWAGEDYINSLTDIERTNLMALIEESIWLQSKSVRRKEPHPLPAPFLVDGDREVLEIMQTSQQLPQKSPRVSAKPGPLLSHHLIRQSSPSLSSTRRSNTRIRDGVLHTCPSEFMRELKQPEQFLERLINLHTWLIESPHNVSDLRAFVFSQWRSITQSNFQNVLDLLYAVGVIAPADAGQTYASVLHILPTNLTVSQFRRACAEKFTQRVVGNHYLLAAIDQLGSAPLERIRYTAFANAIMSDLLVRLTIWEALGSVQRHKKQCWSVTQAGRDLVSALPPVHIVVANTSESTVTISDTDWLDVL